MVVFGFFFWIINARLYSAEQVVIGTTLISIMTLISSFSILGLGNGLIRYLPTSERKNKKINYKPIISIGLLLLAVCFIVVGFFQLLKYVPSVKEALILAATVKPETFTELYFENHLFLAPRQNQPIDYLL